MLPNRCFTHRTYDSPITMKKIIFFLFLISITSLCQAFFLDYFFQLKDGAEQQRIAAEELSKHRKDIRLRKEISVPGQGQKPSIAVSSTKAAADSLDNYIEVEGSLAASILASQCIDGLILGFIAACLNAKLERPWTITAATIASAFAILHGQNKKLGSVPYYDSTFTRHPYEYKMLSLQTVLNMTCILLAAQLGTHMTKQNLFTSKSHTSYYRYC